MLNKIRPAYVRFVWTLTGSLSTTQVLEAYRQGFQPVVGYELNPWLIRLSNFHAWRAGYSGKVSFRQEDLWKVSSAIVCNFKHAWIVRHVKLEETKGLDFFRAFYRTAYCGRITIKNKRLIKSMLILCRVKQSLSRLGVSQWGVNWSKEPYIS